MHCTDYENKRQTLADRRKEFEEFTLKNQKATGNFKSGSEQLKNDKVTLSEEKERITKPYKELIQDHGNETSLYNSLKSEVLALNAKLQME